MSCLEYTPVTASARNLAGNREANHRVLGQRPDRMQRWGRLRDDEDQLRASVQGGEPEGFSPAFEVRGMLRFRDSFQAGEPSPES